MVPICHLHRLAPVSESARGETRARTAPRPIPPAASGTSPEVACRSRHGCAIWNRWARARRCGGAKVETSVSLALGTSRAYTSPSRNEPSPNGSAARAFSSGGERFPDTEEVRSSNLLTPTINSQVRGYVLWPVFFWCTQECTQSARNPSRTLPRNAVSSACQNLPYTF